MAKIVMVGGKYETSDIQFPTVSSFVSVVSNDGMKRYHKTIWAHSTDKKLTKKSGKESVSAKSRRQDKKITRKQASNFQMKE